MTEQIFISLSIIIGIVLIVLWIMKILKQPMIIGYILTGVIISLFLPSVIGRNVAFQSFSSLWISLLLFMVGMELNPLIIKDMGKTSLVAWFFQVLITSIIWFFLSMRLWFDQMTSLYIWIGFSFSSTIVVLKLLSDRGETETTFGILSIGMLIVQDLIVMLILLGIMTMKNIWWNNSIMVIAILLGKVILLWWWLFLISKYIIPKLTKKIAESQEYLFLFSIWRCFVLWTIFYLLWFGIEIGTLVAWITLANSSYRYEIISRIKPLRDFFIVMFFVLLGSQINFNSQLMHYRPQILIFSLFVIIIKPFITMLILWLMWHTKKNNFLAWSSLGQISEFSFLLITMWIASGFLKDPNTLSIVTIVWLITITTSSYVVIYWEKIYHHIKRILKIIPWSRNKEYQKLNQSAFEIILFGYGRFGSNLYSTLRLKYKDILVIDEHPGIITHLQSHKIPCIYWDVWDIDFLEKLNIKETKMIISTVKEFDESMALLKTIKPDNRNIIIVLISNHIQEAIKLYEEWADYVIMPHYIWVDHTSLMLEEYGMDVNKFIENKKTQMHDLKSRHQDLMIETLQSK